MTVTLPLMTGIPAAEEILHWSGASCRLWPCAVLSALTCNARLSESPVPCRPVPAAPRPLAEHGRAAYGRAALMQGRIHPSDVLQGGFLNVAKRAESGLSGSRRPGVCLAATGGRRSADSGPPPPPADGDGGRRPGGLAQSRSVATSELGGPVLDATGRAGCSLERGIPGRAGPLSPGRRSARSNPSIAKSWYCATSNSLREPKQRWCWVLPRRPEPSVTSGPPETQDDPGRDAGRAGRTVSNVDQ
jgi:hypothetical protein